MFPVSAEEENQQEREMIRRQQAGIWRHFYGRFLLVVPSLSCPSAVRRSQPRSEAHGSASAVEVPAVGAIDELQEQRLDIVLREQEAVVAIVAANRHERRQFPPPRRRRRPRRYYYYYYYYYY